MSAASGRCRSGPAAASPIRTASIIALLLAVAAPAAAETAAKPGTVPIEVEVTQGGKRITFRWWRETGAEIAHDGNEWRVRFNRRAFIDGARFKADLADYSPRILGEPGGVAVALTLPEGMRLSQSRDGNAIVAEIAPASAADAPTPVAAPAKPPPPEAKPQPEAKKSAEARKGAPVSRARQLRVVETPDGSLFRFEGAADAAAAVFRRGGGLWIAIEGSLPLDLAELRAAATKVPFIEQVPADGATVLRLATLDGWNPSVRRAEGAWIVELRRQPFRAETPVSVASQPGGLPPRILFGLNRPSAPIRVVDPEVGDELRVVLSPELAQGLNSGLSYVDVQALPSAQGLAFRFLSDGVALRSVEGGVEITRPAGLALSAEDDRQPRIGQPAMLFDFPGWVVPEGAFLERRQSLQQVIAGAPPEGRTAARLELAKFYLGAGYGAEAVGVLDTVRRDDPAAAADNSFHAYKGAAALLAGDREAAAAELRQRTLDNDPEVALWRAELAAENEDWATAAREFPRGQRFLPSFPPALRHRFMVNAAEAALAAGNRGEAGKLIERVLGDAPGPADRNAARLVEARLRQLDGDRDAALGILDEVAAGEDRPSRARAELARTMLRLDGGEIDRGEAIRTLDRLRFAWRGDDFEFTVLKKLAELKLRDGDFRGGIDGLRQAQAAFPNKPEAKAIGPLLSDAFADAFLGPGAETMSPLKALALYDGYRDLLPAGDKGNEIIRRLADRLVGVDLLDRAASLLDEQAKTRLAGRDKARVATRVAVVRLLDRKPELALDALKMDVGPDVPPDLMQQRRHLQARALAELGRNDEALGLLASDTSPDADRLRADVAWRAQNWREAANAFARLAKPPSGDARLDDEDCRTVMNWAAALTLSGDRAGVAALREKYRPTMEKSSYRDAFRVVAGEAADGDIRSLAGKVAQIGDLQSFMAGYRQKIAGQNLSAIN